MDKFEIEMRRRDTLIKEAEALADYVNDLLAKLGGKND